MKQKLKKLVRRVQSSVEQAFQRSDARSYRVAVKHGFFDYQWYQEHYGNFPTAWSAYKDYLHKSTFSNVNPSARFDTESYNRSNTDIFHKGLKPLTHYLYHGQYEGRTSSPALNRWMPKDELVAVDTPTWKSQKIAIVLHIFYEDFVEKFAKCLDAFPTNISVFVTASSEDIKRKAEIRFNKISTVNRVQAVVSENRGRNFGPFLVNFSKELLEYDLMCHVHSKKSLYSGREQTQWFDYLNQYLLKDRHVVKSALRLFDEQKDLGIYYPTSFWMMPAWVNHWTCNKPFTNKFESWGIDITRNFISYPVGGMFWARPEAIKPLLDADYCYSDFPEEPLPNDGSELHALERLIGLLAEKQGYKQFFYYPPQGRFTTDQSYISTSYYKSAQSLYDDLKSFQIVSFDVFDTVLRRKFFEPDYAKLLLAKELVKEGYVSDTSVFLKLRAEAELDCRKAKAFAGDVDIYETYINLCRKLDIDSEQAKALADREFQKDLEQVMPKDEMVAIVNELHSDSREVWFVTDIYYTQEQIELMIKKIGIAVPYRLFVSSTLGLRKDAGTMWEFIKNKIRDEGKSFVHVGDNVRSDAQICGDFGLQNLHILNPLDKWHIAGFDEINAFKNPNENEILKWGPQISHLGRYPFFGE